MPIADCRMGKRIGLRPNEARRRALGNLKSAFRFDCGRRFW